MSIERTRNIFDPMKAYEWEVEIRPAGGVNAPDNSVTAYAQTVSLPEESIESIEINHKSEKTGYAGRVSSTRNISINFFDDESLNVYRYITRWLESIKSSRTGGGIRREDHLGEIVVRQYAVGGNTPAGAGGETPVAVHVFEGAFPLSRGEVSLSYDASEVVKFDVNFYYQVHAVQE